MKVTNSVTSYFVAFETREANPTGREEESGTYYCRTILRIDVRNNDSTNVALRLYTGDGCM